jgi:hypothetical protein
VCFFATNPAPTIWDEGGGGINREFSIMNYYVFPISPTNLFDMTSTTDLSGHVVQV